MPKDEVLTIEQVNKEASEATKKAFDEKMSSVDSTIDSKIEEGTKELVTEKSLNETTEKFLKAEDFANFTSDEWKEVQEQIKKLGPDAEIMSAIDEQGSAIKALQEKGAVIVSTKAKPNSKRNQCEEILKHMFASEDYKKFSDSNFKTGTDQYSINHGGEVKLHSEVINDNKNNEKDGNYDLAQKAVSVSGSHTGTVLISEISNNVEDIPLRKTHIRDLMTVRPTSSSQIVAPEVTGYTDAFTQGAILVAENTEALLSVFTTEENTWGVRRIARAMEISKRYMRENGLSWVMNWILSRLPDQVQFVEDFQILYGDGAGTNLKGITIDAQEFGTLDTAFVAAAVSSVATYNSGTQALVTFAAAHGARNGDNLIIANSVNYNATYTSVIVQNQFTILIDATYAAEATAAWTGNVRSYWYQRIVDAQEFDVLSIGKALLEAGEYFATGIVLHPSAVENLGLLKGTDSHYVGVSRDAAGRLNVNALPIATTTAMPAGHFLIGDFQRAVELVEYTPLSIQFSEDSTDKKKNQVTIIIEEEIILPIYNKLWFITGKFATAITAIDFVSEEG